MDEGKIKENKQGKMRKYQTEGNGKHRERVNEEKRKWKHGRRIKHGEKLRGKQELGRGKEEREDFENTRDEN